MKLYTLFITLFLFMSIFALVSATQEVILLPTSYQVIDSSIYERLGFNISAYNDDQVRLEPYGNSWIQLINIDNETRNISKLPTFYARYNDHENRTFDKFNFVTNELYIESKCIQKQFIRECTGTELNFQTFIDKNNITNYTITHLETDYYDNETGWQKEHIGYWIEFIGNITDLDPELNTVFSSTSNQIDWQDNRTEGTALGLSLEINDSAWTLYDADKISPYIYSSGDFKSLVFYNETSTYWNITQSIADSNGSAEVNDLCSADANCVSYWDLDDNTDGILDSKGSNNGVATGTNNASGLSSGAVRFDGSDYIGIPDDTTLRAVNFKDALVISVWINPTTVVGIQSIVTKRRRSPTAADYVLSTSNANIYFYHHDGTFPAALTTTNPLEANKWQHILIDFRNDDDIIRFYYNGVNIHNGTITSNLTSSNANLNIGSRTEGFGDFFTGQIDEVLIYNRSLSVSEITELYKAGLSQHANANVTLETRTADSYNISDDGLVGLWGMNSNDSGVAVDETGVNNGVWTNGAKPLDASGVVGMGGEFDGTNDYVSVTDNDNLDINSNDFTYSFWIYNDELSTRKFLMNKRGSPTGSDFAVEWTAANKIDLNAGSGTILLTHSVTLTKDTWYHVVFSVDRDNAANTKMYIDGVDDTFGTPTVTTNSKSNVEPLEIGRWSGDGYYFNGKLDEVRIYNRSLSASEIQNLYELGSYHIEWGDWESSGVKEDGVPITSQEDGKFMQFKDVFATNNTDVSAYVLNYSVEIEEEPIVDTCTYTSGDWDIDCSDDCSITSDVDVGGNDISITGTGTFTTASNIFNFGDLYIEGTDSSNRCKVTCLGGCFQ